MGPTRLALSWVCVFACVRVQVRARVLGFVFGVCIIRSLCSNLGPTGARRASHLL